MAMFTKLFDTVLPIIDPSGADPAELNIASIPSSKNVSVIRS